MYAFNHNRIFMAPRPTYTDIAALKAERKRAFTSAERLLDDSTGREMTPAERESFDQRMAAVDRLGDEIAVAERAEGASMKTLRDDALRRGRPEPLDGFDDERPTALIPAGGMRLKAFDNTRAGEASAYRSGQFIRATLLGDERAIRWCRESGGFDVEASIRMAHSAGTNSAGGVLVPEEFSATIIRLVNEYGAFRRLARVVPMGSDTTNIPRRTGGLTAYYTGEGVEGTESDSAWDNVQLVAKKLMVLTRMSSEISEDAIVDMADTLAQETALAFAYKEDVVGFTGDGGQASGGIVGVNVKAIDGDHGMAAVAAATGHDTLGEIDADDILRLMAAIPTYAKRNSAFVCSPVALELVFNAIRISGGGNTAENLANAISPIFLGYRIIVTDVYPDDAAATYNGAPLIGFGNLQQACTLGSRRDIRMALSTDRYFELDQVGVKGTMRHDINVHDLGSATVKSPFAVLVGTS